MVTESPNPSSIDAIEDQTVEELRESGNKCVRDNKFLDALKLYTNAINLSPQDATLFSNRSLVYLRLKQYFYALNDAEKAIDLNGNWSKGYFRRAEVYAAVGHYDSALLSYGKAMSMQPGDRCLLAAAQKAARFSKQQVEYECRLPWLGAGIGIIVGVTISLCDVFMTTKPSIKHPALMVLLVFAIAFLGYIIARTIRHYQKIQKKSLLEPPLDYVSEELNPDLPNSEIETPQTNRSRFTKAQARMRFRKGKS